MKKLISTLLVLLLVLGTGAWYFVAFRMDSMIANQIETSASRSLGTEVSVGGVKTDIKGGSLQISSITVANPPGFRNTYAFTLNGIEAAVDYTNFDIKRVVVEKPEIVVEEKGGDTNFFRILAAMEKKEAAAQSEPEPDGEGKPEPVIVIHHFRMNESRAAFESESMDHYSDLKVKAIELNNIKGTPSEVGQAIATEIISQVSKAAAIELLKAKASEKINDIFGKKKD